MKLCKYCKEKHPKFTLLDEKGRFIYVCESCLNKLYKKVGN